MKRLIEQTACEHGKFEKCYTVEQTRPHSSCNSLCEYCTSCPGGTSGPPDFDAIWRRFYETADRRFKEGLTYNELWFVVYGEEKEEE